MTNKKIAWCIRFFRECTKQNSWKSFECHSNQFFYFNVDIEAIDHRGDLVGIASLLDIREQFHILSEEAEHGGT